MERVMAGQLAGVAEARRPRRAPLPPRRLLLCHRSAALTCRCCASILWRPVSPRRPAGTHGRAACRPAAAVVKPWWVCRTADLAYASPSAPAMSISGSLSKRVNTCPPSASEWLAHAARLHIPLTVPPGGARTCAGAPPRTALHRVRCPAQWALPAPTVRPTAPSLNSSMALQLVAGSAPPVCIHTGASQGTAH